MDGDETWFSFISVISKIILVGKIFVSKAVLSHMVSGSDDQENKIESSNNESLVARNK